MQHIAVILNPNSRKNRRRPAGRADRLRHILGRWGEVHETRQLSDLRPALQAILAGGVDYLVSDGGDGSLHWAVNEARELLGSAGRLEQLPTIVPTNGGTIDFVARKVGITGTAEKILTSLTGGLAASEPPALVALDSLHISGIERDSDGRERDFERIGFALAAGGIGQRFFDKYYQEKHLGTRGIVSVVARAVASHFAGKLHLPLSDSILRYGREVFAPTRARVTIDGKEVPTTYHGAIHAGSLDVALGGVFRVFPLARELGALHFQAGAIVPWEMIRALPDLYRGSAIQSERLFEVRGSEMTVEALGDELLCPIIDGEMFRDLVRLTVRRGPAIQVPKIQT